MTPPVLRRLLDELETVTAGTDLDILIDSPPGVSCPAVTVARRVDAVLLVVDPTPFGYFDFRIAWEAFRSLGLPLAVVINRSGMIGNDEGDKQVKAFCLEHGLPLVGEIPFSHEAACAAARGGLLTDISPAWKSYFREIANKTLHCFEEDLHV